jgi:hypothetical protein
MTDESHVRCRHCRRAAPRILVWATNGCCPWCHRPLLTTAGQDARGASPGPGQARVGAG